MKKRLSSESGFTLIELLIVMLVMGILSVTLANFIFGWFATAGLEQTKANLTYDAQYAVDDINTDITLSGGVDQTNVYSDPNAPSGGWTSGSQTLILSKVATDSSGNVIYRDATDYVTLKDEEIYYLSGTTLYRRTLSSGVSGDTAVTTCPPASATASCPADTTIATGVSGLTFTYYDANNNSVTPNQARSVQVALTLSTPYGTEPVNVSYTTRMVFRND